MCSNSRFVMCSDVDFSVYRQLSGAAGDRRFTSGVVKQAKTVTTLNTATLIRYAKATKWTHKEKR